MKKNFKNLRLAIFRYSPKPIAVIVALLIFLFISSFFVVEKSVFAQAWQAFTGLFGGMALGGILAWTIGGIGIVAMGTGIGLSAVSVIAIGAVVGGVFGGGVGALVSLAGFVRNPSKYDVTWWGIILAVILAAACYFAVKLVAKNILKDLVVEGEQN